MLKHILTICMIFLLPAVMIQLLISLLFKVEFDWGYPYIMAIFSLVAAIILISVHDIKGRIKEDTKGNYTASVPSAPMIVLTIIMVLNTTITVQGLETETWVIRITVMAAIILLAFLKFKFYIEEKTLIYEIILFKSSLYKKRIFPDEIIHIKFIRTGWAGKGAIIQVKKGLNIRVINFKPTTVCPDLNAFAEKYSISLSKTYDYGLLEKSSHESYLRRK